MKGNTMSMPAEPKSSEKKGFDKYEIEDAVRTLVRAEEIKADPKLMAACSGHIAKQKKHIDSVAGLRKKAAELDAPEAESPAEDKSEE